MIRDGSHPLHSRRREPYAGAGQANGLALLRFGWTISDNLISQETSENGTYSKIPPVHCLSCCYIPLTDTMSQGNEVNDTLS